MKQPARRRSSSTTAQPTSARSSGRRRRREPRASSPSCASGGSPFVAPRGASGCAGWYSRSSLLLIVVAGLAVLGSSLFSIKEVTVSGAVNSRGDALDVIVADLDGEAVLRVDTDDFERRIEQIPWVEAGAGDDEVPQLGADRDRRAPADGHVPGRRRQVPGDRRPGPSARRDAPASPIEYLLVSTDNPPNTAAGEYAPNGFAAAGLLARVLTPTMRPLVDSIVVAADGSDVRLLLEGGTEVVAR